MKTQTYFHSLRLSLVLFGNQYPSNGFFPPQFLIIRLTLASVRALRSSMRCRSSALKSPRRCFSRLRRKRATSSRSIGGFGIERIIASIICLYKGTTSILNTNTVRMKNLFLNTIFSFFIESLATILFGLPSITTPNNAPLRMGQKKESITFVILSFAWCHQESNRGHKDFQSFALPTELWHLAFVCECKGIANFITVQIFFDKIFAHK